MSLWKWALGGAGIFVVLILGWLNFTPEGRLIGNSYDAPPPQALTPTAQSSAADLSSLNVDFASAGPRFGGLMELAPDLRLMAEIADGRFHVRGIPEKAGWYSDRSGPLFYRVVSGDFMVDTEVRTVKAADGKTRPSGKFNSAGLLVRDPASDTGNMRWVMYNIGQQDGFYGTEAKSTVPDTGEWHFQRLAGFGSRSTLWLTPVPEGVVQARLRICRVGSEFRFFKQLPGSDGWSEEAYSPRTKVLGNGADTPTDGVKEAGVIRFVRPDISPTVQVGLIANPGMAPSDGMGQFTGISFERISAFSDCTANR
jgi:hypothetical protein